MHKQTKPTTLLCTQNCCYRMLSGRGIHSTWGCQTSGQWSCSGDCLDGMQRSASQHSAPYSMPSSGLVLERKQTRLLRLGMLEPLYLMGRMGKAGLARGTLVELVLQNMSLQMMQLLHADKRLEESTSVKFWIHWREPLCRNRCKGQQSDNCLKLFSE